MSAAETDEFEQLIRAMDNVYLEWLAKKRETASASIRKHR